MPATLAHIGVQGFLSRAFQPGADLRWVLLGLVIPDVPWIVRRAIATLSLPIDPIGLMAYAGVQASLAFSLMLATAAAQFAIRRVETFAILSLNVLAHLLLDALELKWSSGIHLWGPASWRPLSWGVLEPEGSAVVLMYAAAGLFLVRHGRELWTRPLSWRWSGARAAAAAGLCAVYAGAPGLFAPALERSNSYHLAVLRDPSARPGRRVEFDRAVFDPGPDGGRLRIFTGEVLSATGCARARPAMVTVRGRFADERTVEIADLRAHTPGVRDGAAILGLLVVGAAWLSPGVRRSRRRSDSPSVPAVACSTRGGKDGP